MIEYIESLEKKAYSTDIQESIEAISQLIKIGDDITEILTRSIEVSNNRFAVTERVSLIFVDFLTKLKKYQNHEDVDMSFWAATLIVNYQINDSMAEDILLHSIENGTLDKAYIATTILCRVKNSRVSAAIALRLRDYSLSKEAVIFFKEKLSSISNVNG